MALELTYFQNDDGGFGLGLEPDMRSSSSSPLSTALGLQTLADLGFTSDFKMVSDSISCLINNFDEDARTWRPVPWDSNDYPHAPWWQDEDDSLVKIFDGCRIIPRALIVGLMHHYNDRVDSDWLENLTEDTVSDIERLERLGTGGGDDLVYTSFLAQERNLPENHRSRLIKRIFKTVPQVAENDQEKWSSYVISPLKIAPLSNFMTVELLVDSIQRNLDYLISSQTNDGS